LPVDPASIDAVVITHAHLDHCGYLPILVREGFSGPVVCSRETAKLMEIVLRDAAHLQEQEARWARESGLSKHADPRPLFDSDDAEKALNLLQPLATGAAHPLKDGEVRLRRAGHILGSRFATVAFSGRTIAFSGDLGRTDHPLLLGPEPIGKADSVVVESTYGDRLHVTGDSDRLAEALTRTLKRGGVALLPAFAVDRTPMILHELQRLVEEGEIPDVPVYVDSPMALSALAVYRSALQSGNDFRPELLGAQNPFDPGRLSLVHGVEESIKLNDPKRPCIMVSASGMAEGGRVLHHLEHQLPRSRNSVILTGFQVPGTRGRALADGARTVKIHGRYVPVRAEVVNLRGYSAHADSNGILDWLATAEGANQAFVVHGEPQSSEALAELVRDRLRWTAVTPRYGEKVRVD